MQHPIWLRGIITGIVFKLNMQFGVYFAILTERNACFCSGEITHLNKLGLHLFDHDVRASPEDDRLRALLVGNQETCCRMEDTKSTHGNNLDPERGKRS